jgi:hypothetical protein
MAVFFLWFYAGAPTNPAEAGSDSGEFYGRYLDGVAFWFPLANLVGWFVGVFLGLAISAGRSERRPDNANPA